MSNNEDTIRSAWMRAPHEHLWLNPRGVRKAPRKKVPYDGKPTLHAPGCKSIARTEESKPFKVPAMTLNLFDRRDVWYCQNCLVGQPSVNTV